MASNRLQCLCSSRQIVKNAISLRAAFSTTRSTCVDNSTSNSAADILASYDTRQPASRFSLNRTSRPLNRSTINQGHDGSRPKRGNSEATSRLMNLVRDQVRNDDIEAAAELQSTGLEDIRKHNLAQNLSKQVKRRWKAGDVYAPHDLSPAEAMKWKRRDRPTRDAFDILAMNPLDHYRNFSIMSEYMSTMGRIKHSKETGLRPVNQRKIAKAIRRSIGMGMMPSVHRHPEILQKEVVRAEISSQNRLPGL